MAAYTIINRTSGADLGTYLGETPQGALDAMAYDSGYKSYADMLDKIGGDSSDLIVTSAD
jgi:hypothetical protein